MRRLLALIGLCALGCAYLSRPDNTLASPEDAGAPGVKRFLVCAPNTVIALPAEFSDVMGARRAPGTGSDAHSRAAATRAPRSRPSRRRAASVGARRSTSRSAGSTRPRSATKKPAQCYNPLAADPHGGAIAEKAAALLEELDDPR